MTRYNIPQGSERVVEGMFSLLGKALRAYKFTEIVVQEEGFAWGGHTFIWADCCYRDNLSSAISLKISGGARDVMPAVYSREGRPWYSSIWRLDVGGQRSWEWDFDSRPREEIMSETIDTYLDDLVAFPRADEYVPLWMRPALAAAGAWDPATDRLTLDGSGQPAGVPAVMEEPEFWYLLPVRDSPTGPRRAFGHLPPGIDEADAGLPLTGPPG